MDTIEEWDTFEKVKYVQYFISGPVEIWFVETFTTQPKENWESFCEKMLHHFANHSEKKNEIINSTDALAMLKSVVAWKKEFKIDELVEELDSNEKEVWIVRNGSKRYVQARDIRVGNIIWLRENDEVPCDLILLGTPDSQGICYVKTAALDGETDLKTRLIPPACVGIDFELLYEMKGVIECPSPIKDIRRFDANMRLFPPFLDNDMCPLTNKNAFLQSFYLRNTEWACGVAVYTGNETKLGMCKSVPEPKLTAVDTMIDKLTRAIFVFQRVVVIVLGIAGNVWKDTEARKLWFNIQKKNLGMSSLSSLNDLNFFALS